MADDRQLVTAWRDGDDRAGRELFEMCLPSIQRFFRNKVTNDADDLVQSTLLACLESRDRFRAEARFRSFALGVANNILYKHLRSKFVRDARIELGSTSVSDLAPGPSTMLGKDEEEQRMIESLRRVPIDQQVVLELHYWEELTVREIAEVLELPLGTVATRLQAGRKALRACMGERGR